MIQTKPNLYPVLLRYQSFMKESLGYVPEYLGKAARDSSKSSRPSNTSP